MTAKFNAHWLNCNCGQSFRADHAHIAWLGVELEPFLACSLLLLLKNRARCRCHRYSYTGTAHFGCAGVSVGTLVDPWAQKHATTANFRQHAHVGHTSCRVDRCIDYKRALQQVRAHFSAVYVRGRLAGVQASVCRQYARKQAATTVWSESSMITEARRFWKLAASPIGQAGKNLIPPSIERSNIELIASTAPTSSYPPPPWGWYLSNLG